MLKYFLIFLIIVGIFFTAFFVFPEFFSSAVSYQQGGEVINIIKPEIKPVVHNVLPLDKTLYDKMLMELAKEMKLQILLITQDVGLEIGKIIELE